MRALIFVIAIAATGAAQTETLEQKLNYEAARQALQNINTEMNLGLCFDQARLMIFGFVNKVQGHPIEKYVESGALPLDSSDYQFVAKGYEMKSALDDGPKVYFTDCAKRALYATQ